MGELKSKTSLLEMRVHEQNEELMLSRDKLNHVLSKMSSLDTELQSKTSKLEDLETREERWRLHASEMTREVKSRNTDWYKREEKLMDELTLRDSTIKEHSKVLQQSEQTMFRLKEENGIILENNESLTKQVIFLILISSPLNYTVLSYILDYSAQRRNKRFEE